MVKVRLENGVLRIRGSIVVDYEIEESNFAAVSFLVFSNGTVMRVFHPPLAYLQVIDSSSMFTRNPVTGEYHFWDGNFENAAIVKMPKFPQQQNFFHFDCNPANSPNTATPPT